MFWKRKKDPHVEGFKQFVEFANARAVFTKSSGKIGEIGEKCRSIGLMREYQAAADATTELSLKCLELPLLHGPEMLAAERAIFEKAQQVSSSLQLLHAEAEKRGTDFGRVIGPILAAMANVLQAIAQSSRSKQLLTTALQLGT